MTRAWIISTADSSKTLVAPGASVVRLRESFANPLGCELTELAAAGYEERARKTFPRLEGNSR